MDLLNFDFESPFIKAIYWAIMVFLGLANYFTRRNLKSKRSHIYLVNNIKSFLSIKNRKFANEDYSYLEKILDKYHFLYEATIKNNGNKDIGRASIYAPLKIILPEHYRFLEVNPKNLHQEIGLVMKKMDKELVFSWELLKVGEFLTYEAIIEYNPALKNSTGSGFNYDLTISELKNKLKITHRITDLSEVKMYDSPLNKTIDYSRYISDIIFYSLLCVSFFYMAPLNPYSEPDWLDKFISITSYIFASFYGIYVIYHLSKILRNRFMKTLG